MYVHVDVRYIVKEDMAKIDGRSAMVCSKA